LGRLIEPVWLDGIREYKRTLKDIERFVPPDQIYGMVTTGPIWQYKRDQAYYEKRDRAFLSFLYVSGCRVAEAIKVHKNQFDLSDTDF